MILYGIIVIILFLGAITRQSKWFYYMGLFLMWGLMAFRDPNLGGFDAYFYQKFFDDVPILSGVIGWDSTYSWGYTLLNSAVKTISSQYMTYQIIYSTICFFLLYRILQELDLSYRQKSLFLISFFCFRYMWDMWVILRQNIANLFFWWLTIIIYRYWMKKERTVFADWRQKGLILLAILIPAGFHSSGWLNIIILPMLYGLHCMELKKKRILVLGMSLLIYFVLSPSFDFILNILSMLDTRYLMYDGDSQSGNVIYFFARLFIFAFFAWRYESFEHQAKGYFLDMMALMTLIGAVNAPIVVRICDYYAIGMYGIMGCLPLLFKQNNRDFINGVFCLLMLVLLYRFLCVFDDGVFFNYQIGI